MDVTFLTHYFFLKTVAFKIKTVRKKIVDFFTFHENKWSLLARKGFTHCKEFMPKVGLIQLDN